MPLLKERFGSLFADMTGHIVGVQFRECATFGGSVWDGSVFRISSPGSWRWTVKWNWQRPDGFRSGTSLPGRADRDILAAVWVQLDGRKGVYHTVRNAGTDFPVLACAVSRGEGETAYRLSIGARPMKAVSLEVTPDTLETCPWMRYPLAPISGREPPIAGIWHRFWQTGASGNWRENRHEYYCDTEWYGAHCRGASRYDLV